MNVGIVGASGYSGETLVRLLSRHPRARLVRVTSRQHAGKTVNEVMPAMRGTGEGMVFTESDPGALAGDGEVDCWFLALPHGVASEYARTLLAAGKRVIDLSADFRLRSPERYAEFYGHAHPAPELLGAAAYVVPELCTDRAWKESRLLACPGCYPTSVQLPLAPLLSRRLIDGSRIVIHSMSGVSGAGRQAKEFYSFCERAESVAGYGMPKHRHLSEMEEQLSGYWGRGLTLQFNPHLVPMRRGILTTITVPKADGSWRRDVVAAWEAAFGASKFVHLLPEGIYPDTAQVVGTNRADLAVVEDPRTGNFILLCAIDNLLKGASGQAVQIFNLIHGFAEEEGLS